VETTIWSATAEIGACAVWVAIWAFETAEGVLAVCVREEGDLGLCEREPGEQRGSNEEEDGVEHGNGFCKGLLQEYGDTMMLVLIRIEIEIEIK
jgi:hypothetical protein